MKDLQRKLLIAFTLLTVLFLTGITGFVLIENLSVLDAVYFTVITLATVGYGDISPKTGAGKIFDIFLVMGGMSTFIYAVTTITAFFVEGELGGYLRRKKMQKMIQNLQDHYIICGSGEVGKHIIEELTKTKRQFVVIENHPDTLKKLSEKDGLLYVEGNAADDHVLLDSGIKKAKGLVTTLPTDKDNLFVVITARSLNPNIRIVTRSLDEGSIPKLTRAGADEIVSTNAIGGMRMASVLLRPNVVSFLDKMLRGSDAALRVDEVEVTDNSRWINKTLQEAEIMDKTGLVIISIKDKNTNTYQHNPKSSYVITKNDVLIVIGNPEQLEKLRLLIQS
jgi:voltage-gated potassium channel